MVHMVLSCTCPKTIFHFEARMKKTCTWKSGNFWVLLELLSKYITMHKHVQYIISEEIGVSYCNIMGQNKITSVMVSRIRESVVEWARKAKCFSANLDYTRDLSYREQMSFTLQFLDVCESDLIVQEDFITFQETTGQLLFIWIINCLWIQN